MKNLKIILLVAAVIAGVTASLMIRHQAQLKLRENDEVLRHQRNQLAELAAENQRLSNRIAQADHSVAVSQTPELAKLSAEAEALRWQTNALAMQLAEKRRSRPSPATSKPALRKHSLTGVSVLSDSDSEEYAKQLERMAIDSGKKTDARKLGSAVRKHVREHNGEFPSNFDEAAPYFDKDRPPPQTGGFELVFQGSLTELTNVPSQAVALIREREAWPTPSGKWARVYVMAGGELQIVESGDNFESWEAEHIIPPPVTRPE